VESFFSFVVAVVSDTILGILVALMHRSRFLLPLPMLLEIIILVN
jgi:hypothetical protein